MEYFIVIFFLGMLSWDGPEDVPQGTWGQRDLIVYQEPPPSMCENYIEPYRSTPHAD